MNEGDEQVLAELAGRDALAQFAVRGRARRGRRTCVVSSCAPTDWISPSPGIATAAPASAAHLADFVQNSVPPCAIATCHAVAVGAGETALTCPNSSDSSSVSVRPRSSPR